MDMSGVINHDNRSEMKDSVNKMGSIPGINIPGFQSGSVTSPQTLDIHDDGLSACMVLDDQSLWCWGRGGISL